jgi:Peptidase family M28
MTLSRPACLRFAAVFAAWAVVLSTAPRAADPLLLRIDKRQPVAVPSAVMAQMTPIQELATAWIVEVPASLAGRLAALRLSFETLDSATAGKPYYLVFAPDMDEIGALASIGQVRALDEGVGLFWTDAEDVREIVPAAVSLKRLSGRIRTPLSFLGPSRARAVERAAGARLYEPFDARIAEMVGQVSESRLAALIGGLQSFQTRYASTSNCEASGSAIYDHFIQRGIPVEQDPFTFSSSNYATRNIIATIPGKLAPDRVVIVCAHYDSTSTQARTAAPGADDNASGTAAVLEIAQVLAGYQFDFTVKFAAFSAEEWGLYGSRHYALEAKQRGESIIGVVNLDMIGYADRAPEDLEVIVNDRSDWLGARFMAAAGKYVTLDMVKTINASATGSDHSPFWDQGYSAMLGIEDYPLKNPNYHKTTDTIDTLDLDFATSVTKAALAAVAELAQPASPVAAPTGVTLASQVVRSIFTSRKMVVLMWTASPGSIAGYNVYRSPTSHGAYQRLNASLLKTPYYVDRLLPSDATYYYVVTAVDAQGRESNYSVEVH